MSRPECATGTGRCVMEEAGAVVALVLEIMLAIVLFLVFPVLFKSAFVFVRAAVLSVLVPECCCVDEMGAKKAVCFASLVVCRGLSKSSTAFKRKRAVASP